MQSFSDKYLLFNDQCSFQLTPPHTMINLHKIYFEWSNKHNCDNNIHVNTLVKYKRIWCHSVYDWAWLCTSPHGKSPHGDLSWPGSGYFPDFNYNAKVQFVPLLFFKRAGSSYVQTLVLQRTLSIKKNFRGSQASSQKGSSDEFPSDKMF